MKQIEMIEKAELQQITREEDPFDGVAADNGERTRGGEYTWRYLKNGRSQRKTRRYRGDDRNAGKLKKKRIQSFLPVVLSLFFCVMAYSIAMGRNRFDYAAAAAQTVVTMGNGTALTFRDLAYYVIVVERDGAERAQAYDPENTKAWWNLYLNDEGDSSGYMSDLARKAVLDYAVRDSIYAQEAEKAGFCPDDALLAEADERAEEMYASLNERELAICGYTAEELKLIMEKETLAHEYMIYLSGQSEEQTAFYNYVTEYDVGGSYYNSLLEAYAVETDDTLWNQVRMGFVTINTDRDNRFIFRDLFSRVF